MRQHSPAGFLNVKINLVCTLLFSLAGGQVWAEERKSAQAGTARAAESAEDAGLMVVTARHGSESSKDVPFGISVLDGKALESNRMYTLDSALRSVPGVDINEWGGPTDANVRIRGVGSLYQVSMDDSSVVLNVDGVSMSSRYLSLGSLDVKQIEVLKGPQGTLYGRSSSAGAVNVVTNKPTGYFEGQVAAEYGQDHQHMEEAVLSGPLAETLRARFAVRNRGAKHWVTNLEDSKPVSDPRSLEYRGSLLWQPTESVSALLTAERQDNRQYLPLMVLRPYRNTPSVQMTPGLMDGNKASLERYSLEASRDFAVSRVTSITALTRMDNHATKAQDKLVMQALFGMPMEFSATDNMGEDVVSQELRWQSLPEADIFWVSGASFFHAKRHLDQVTPMEAKEHKRNFNTDSYALYGEVTYPLTDRLKLTGGVRQTWDHKKYAAVYRLADVSTSDRRTLSDNHTTGRVALSWAVTPHASLYGSLSTGSKPAGFNDYASSIDDGAPYKASRIYSAEIGFKSELPEQDLVLNGALFASKVRDDHLLGYDYLTMNTHTESVDTRSYGAELEGRWHIDRQWSLAAAASYIAADIASNVGGVSGGDVTSGNGVPDVPRWSSNLNLRYLRNLPPFLGLNAPMVDGQINYRLVGKRPADPQNHFDLNGYDKLDARIGLRNGPAEFYLWGDNLLDKQYDLYGYYMKPTVQVGMPARGRSVGAGLRWDF